MIKKIYTTSTANKEQRSQSIHIQQPYLESDQNTLGQFPFDKENIVEKKELLFTIWKKRQHEMKTIQINSGNTKKKKNSIRRHKL